MTRHFFEGRSDLFEKYWDTIKEHELRHFFRKYFGKTVEKKDRPYAFVVYGASGYTGSLILEYIYSNADKINLGTDLTFVLAGRTPEKLQARLDEVLEKFPDVKYRPDIFKVNIDSTAHIREMILKCRCVLNVAGPFLNTKADLLVEGCIEYDCDYVDVNGEVPFTHKLIGMHDWAKKKNVLIVPNSAGAGGLPDVAAFYTSEELKKKAKKDADVEKMHCFMFSNGGAPSGGTLATRAAMTASIKHVAKIMGNPFALGGVVGDGKRPEDQDRELNSVRYFKEFEGWSGAFTYAFFDTRLVRRSNWLLSDLGAEPMGRKMNFSEHLLFPTEQAAKSMASSNTSSKKEEEKLKAEGKLFKLGQGLDEETRSKLFTEYHLHANAGDGTTIRTKVIAGDGYDETARLSVEMVLLLTTKRDSLPFEGGVLTPSVAGGRPFLDAIRSSGIAFEVLDDDYKVDFEKVKERLV
ncbi:uncharacterized protein MICPUCDRAFT_37936 [Micromonas pusilla CCMP1545]|uniref:Predicted protein n=1 Tax=Micromonas pusilla (strain CCMP1545) TaxID=564608 RepID=C1MHP8_MICPC|nr:uncharacterized protein MICPUCDRAFT_37936 [Micromonas pusilla CCMP1545]EEH60243.1 predicted protein [Micromonas pusilla CCMP1545]|eukprot:XP_003054991.1 predicted protein [Micromonas pusilla CCMP1545]